MAAEAARLAGPFGASAVLHGAVGFAIFVLTLRPPVVMPPIYRVDIVGAPPAPKPAAGVVPTTATPPVPQPKTEPPAHPTPPKTPVAPDAKSIPRPAPPKATPTPPAAKAAPATKPPAVAASRAGGAGTDVANVHTEGIDFPYPYYLENIVRQVALNFQPEDPSSLRAEVAFLIKRDGTLIPNSFRFIQRSSNYAFDLEAQGAIEKAASQFGPLPTGFADDVLPVVFSFDPGLLR